MHEHVCKITSNIQWACSDLFSVFALYEMFLYTSVPIGDSGHILVCPSMTVNANELIVAGFYPNIAIWKISVGLSTHHHLVHLCGTENICFKNHSKSVIWMPSMYTIPPVQTGPRLAGIVWTLAGTCPRVPTKHVGFRGRKSTLGLVIDIAQLFSSNVRMREMCWHGDLTQSRCAQQKPLNRDCPRQAGAFDDRVDGRS